MVLLVMAVVRLFEIVVLSVMAVVRLFEIDGATDVVPETVRKRD